MRGERGEEPKEEPPHVKDEAAVALGRLGSKKGGAASAATLTPEQRSEIAKKAVIKRWAKKFDCFIALSLAFVA